MIRVLFLLLLFPAVLSAQLEITWGIPQREQRKTMLTGFLGSDSSYIYGLRKDYSTFGNNDPIIERYHQDDLALDYSKRISHRRFDDVQLEPAAQFFFDGKIIVFATYYDRTKDIHFAYAEILDEQAVVVRSWTEVGRIAADKKSNRGTFYFGLSEDSSGVLIVANPPYEKYADEKFSLSFVDANLSVKWKHDILPPYKDQYFTLDNFIVNDSGDVYMLATISKESKGLTRKERRNNPQYYHSALVYNPGTASLSEYTINLDPKFISNIIMSVTGNGDIICSGFYSNKSSNAITGTFYLKIDKQTRQIVHQGTMDFPTEFLTQFMSAKRAEKNKELYDYSLRYLVQREDGGAILVAEQYYEYEICNTDPRSGTQTCRYYYYYNDIIVVNINPEGKIDWARKIPKLQVSHDDGGYYLSFAFAVSDNTLHFMFNDNPRNLNVPAGGKYRYMSNLKRSVAVLVTMDMKGEQSRQAMYRSRDLKIWLRPKLYMQIGNHKMFLYGQRKSTYRLAKVTL